MSLNVSGFVYYTNVLDRRDICNYVIYFISLVYITIDMPPKGFYQLTVC